MIGDLFAGGGIGLLLGYLPDLSVEPVTKLGIVAITGALGIILGWQRGQGPDRTWRLGTFGILCVVGVTGGLAIRADAWFTQSVQSEVARWEASDAITNQPSPSSHSRASGGNPMASP